MSNSAKPSRRTKRATTKRSVKTTTRPVRVKRKSPLEQPKLRVSKPRGFFDVDISNENRQHFEPSELVTFFQALPVTSFWHPYFFIQYFYGCRLSEPALIQDAEDVNFKKKTILIRRLKKAQEKDGFREIVYPADPRVLECVRAAQRWKEAKQIESNPFLFASGRRRTTKEVGAERLSQLRNEGGWQAVSRFTAHRMFQKIARNVKLPENLRHSHVLRHTRAPLMLALGAAPEQVQDVLGHSSSKMTQRYTGIAENMKEKLLTVDVLAQLMELGLGL